MHWSMVAIALLFCSAAQAYDWTIAPEDIESLTKAEAQSLVSKRKGRLILSGLTSVSPEVAKVLAQYKGSLELDSLTTISPKVAEALATHRGDGLSLDGLTDISEIGRAHV